MASSTTSPPIPELTPGWEVYKNQRGAILYGNNLIGKCDFSAPVAQQAQRTVIYTSSSGGLSDMPYGYVPMSSQDPFTGRGGLKRKQSRRKQSKRKQIKRNQSKRKQSKRIS